jgi:hypothetical protein
MRRRVRPDDRSGVRATTDTTRIDPAHFRRVLARLPTGVSIITAPGSAAPIGMVANSVTSVSLDPALGPLCSPRIATTGRGIRDARSFCIKIMAGNHEEVTRRSPPGDRPLRRSRLRGSSGRPGTRQRPGRDRVPYRRRARSRRPHDRRRPSATHGGHSRACQPLVFFRGAYGSFRSADANLVSAAGQTARTA